MLCPQPQNLQSCPCTYPSCSRKGICCDCLRYHLKNQELPACLIGRQACCFSPEAEKTFDRSIGKFIEIEHKRVYLGRSAKNCRVV